jgi:hypothetical protein
VAIFLAIHAHYRFIGRELRNRRSSPHAETQNTVVLLVRELDPATMRAIGYLRALRPERSVPIFVGPAQSHDEVARRWRIVAPRLGELTPLPPAEGRAGRAVLAFVRGLRRPQDEFVTVIIPEVVTGRSLVRLLMPGSTFWLKAALLFEPGVVTCNVPMLPEQRGDDAGRPGTAAGRPLPERALEPARNVVLIPVSSVHDATVRAVVYAKTLHASRVEAIFLASEPEEGQPVVDEWLERRLDIPLAIVDAPFRDLTSPLLHEIRKHTARGDTVVTVVLPEFVVRRWWEHLLHGQTGLFLKRLLLFEPSVIVTSVPYRL